MHIHIHTFKHIHTHTYYGGHLFHSVLFNPEIDIQAFFAAGTYTTLDIYEKYRTR